MAQLVETVLVVLARCTHSCARERVLNECATFFTFSVANKRVAVFTMLFPPPAAPLNCRLLGDPKDET